MVNFEEWLVFDEIEKNVYEKSIDLICAENAARQTLKIFFESLKQSNEKDCIVEFWQSFGSEKPDDPFTGDEDAKPVFVSKDTEEEKTKFGYDSPELKKALRDATLWIRWRAIAERKANIERLKKLRDEHKSQSPSQVRENEEVDPDEEEFEMLGRKSFDIKKAIPALEKLGYLRTEDLYNKNKTDEEIQEELVKLLYQAAEEKNDLPDGVKEEDLFSNWNAYVDGKEDKLIPTQKSIEASKDFFENIKKIFARSFSKIARDSGRYFSSQGKSKAGHTLFMDPDDVASKFAMMMISNLTKRPWKWKGTKRELLGWDKIKGYKNFSFAGKEELNNIEDKDLDQFIAYFRTFLRKLSSKEEEEIRDAHSPSSRMPDSINSRSVKANIINSDLQNNNLEFYKKYLKDHMSGDAKTVGWWSEREKQAKRAKKEELAGYSKEDRMRIEIMSHIISLQSRHSDKISLDPEKIADTLEYYRNNFILKSKPKATFFGAMGKKETDDGEGDYDPTADDAGRKEDSLGVGTSENPARQASSNEYKRKLMKSLFNVLRSIRDPNQRIAICIKWGLNCSSGGVVNSISGFENATLRMTQAGKVVGSKSTDCHKQLQSIGLSPEEVAEKMALATGQVVDSPDDQKAWVERVRRFITLALKDICERLPSELSKPESPMALPKPIVINRRFDPKRSSPLLGRR